MSRVIRMHAKTLNKFSRIALSIIRFKITEPGWMLIGGAALAGVLIISMPVYRVLSTLMCLMVVAFIASYLYRPKIKLQGKLPDKIIAGTVLDVPYVITNRSRFSAYDLSVGLFDLPPTLKEVDTGRFIPRLEPGKSATFNIRLKPLRRGLYDSARARCFTTFPFNLFREGPYLWGRERVLVLPSFHAIDQMDIPLETRYQPGGVALASQVGESPEYIGSRPFRPGDLPRRIDPRAWARLAAPAVKEYQEEYYCHVAVVMDTWIPRSRRPGPTGYAELEAAVSLTAAIADFMSRSERIIDFFAAGPDLYVYRTGRNSEHIENLLEILACVEHCRHNPFDIVAPALSQEFQNTTAVIFVLLDWDQSREKLVRAAVEAGCSVKIIIVREKNTSRSIHEAENWAGEFRIVNPEHISRGELTWI